MDSRGISKVKFPTKIQQWPLLLIGIRSCWQEQPCLWLCCWEKFAGTCLFSMLGQCMVPWSKAQPSPPTATLVEVSLAGGYFPCLCYTVFYTVFHCVTQPNWAPGLSSTGTSVPRCWDKEYLEVAANNFGLWMLLLCFHLIIFSGLERGESPPFVTLAYT